MKRIVFALILLMLAVMASAQTANGHEFVDLGLSVKWATCNIGADRQEAVGQRFAWGEVATKAEFLMSNYKWYINGSMDHIKKYNNVDNKKVLEPGDDAARVKWGDPWRMPTKEEFEELHRNCTWSWTAVGGIYGCRAVSKKNGNSIFFPVSGIDGDGSIDFKRDGYYWASTTQMYGMSYVLEVSESHVKSSDRILGRSVGVCIRPVLSGDYSVTNQVSTGGTQKRFCTQCGNKVEPSHKYCGSCGSKL